MSPDVMRESPPRVEPTAADVEEAHALPLGTRFSLGVQITGVQQAFLDAHGFILFGGVASPDEVEMILSEVDQVQARILTEQRTAINGIPLCIGEDGEGQPFIQRFAFTSRYSQAISTFVHDARFMPVRGLIGEQTRVGEGERDGVVFNRNMTVEGSAYTRLGWHTDGLRDLFLLHASWPWLRLPGPMLNVGMHFDRVTAEDGGLRLIPGSHSQGFLSMLFRKPYFLSHRADPKELAVETEPGDLTVHDGRMWHRVERSPWTGRRSLRRTMYVPYLVDAYQPKSEASGTPFYHRLSAPLERFTRAG
jgi:ectoine hydroxylase-related dioxygenase (phytanoyl-CoA dioxygenase family)